MKFKIVILSLGLLLAARGAFAQWVVSDPTNLAQGIVNSTKQVQERPDHVAELSGNREDLRAGGATRIVA